MMFRLRQIQAFKRILLFYSNDIYFIPNIDSKLEQRNAKMFGDLHSIHTHIVRHFTADVYAIRVYSGIQNKFRDLTWIIMFVSRVSSNHQKSAYDMMRVIYTPYLRSIFHIDAHSNEHTKHKAEETRVQNRKKKIK